MGVLALWWAAPSPKQTSPSLESTSTVRDLPAPSLEYIIVTTHQFSPASPSISSHHLLSHTRPLPFRLLLLLIHIFQSFLHLPAPFIPFSRLPFTPGQRHHKLDQLSSQKQFLPTTRICPATNPPNTCLSDSTRSYLEKRSSLPSLLEPSRLHLHGNRSLRSALSSNGYNSVPPH